MKKTLRQMYVDDQRERRRLFGRDGSKSPSLSLIRELELHDAERLEALRAYQKGRALRTPEEYYFAAMLLQHGKGSGHFKEAHVLAQKSATGGYAPAYWLAAATLDRYLKSVGRRQKYGTQFYMGKGGVWKMWPYLKKTTDGERKKMGVESLRELKKFAHRLNRGSRKPAR